MLARLGDQVQALLREALSGPHLLSVTVELVGGRGECLWPAPGRIMAVAPSHNFAQFAHAVDQAFARWDLSHLHAFELADGRQVSRPNPDYDDPEHPPLDSLRTKVSRTLALGSVFTYVFDLGDDWRHRCEVAPVKIDPVEVMGVLPTQPLPYWGWGSIPDQYGRRWNGDDGESRLPPPPPEDWWEQVGA